MPNNVYDPLLLAAAPRFNANKKAYFGTMLFYCNPLHIPDLHRKLKAIQWTEKGQMGVTQEPTAA